MAAYVLIKSLIVVPFAVLKHSENHSRGQGLFSGSQFKVQFTWCENQGCGSLK